MTDAELAALARKATPGPWKMWAMTVMADRDETGRSDKDKAIEVATTYCVRDGHLRTFDGHHICAWSPERALVVLALIKAWRTRDDAGECAAIAAWDALP